jgi:hypothetical protein
MMRIRLGLMLLATVRLAAADAGRRDAVFILGEDGPGQSSFFEPATHYYAERIRRDVDLFVAGARSLQEVREWLVRARNAGDQPWRRIVLVAHGSPWAGLAVPLYADGTRADLPDLERAIRRGEFPSLPASAFDSQTQIILESCGVGRRSDLIDLYAQLFGGTKADRTRVTASRNWIEFGEVRIDGGELKTWRAERHFEATVVAHAELDSGQEKQLRSKLAAQLEQTLAGSPRGGEESWRTAPVHIELALVDASQCRSDRAVRGLSAHESVTDKLRGYGLREKDLAWRVEQGPKGCALVGQGTLAVLGQGSLSGDLLP